VLDLAKDNGVVLLFFPPHVPHKLQPSDRSIYGAFKKFVNSASDAWLRSHPGKTMTICDIPSTVNQSLRNALTPKNIKSGFLVTGIWPFNTDIFTDEDFLPSAVTDRPLQDNKNPENVGLSDSHTPNSNLDVSSQPSTPGLTTGHSSSESNLYHASPVEIRPLPEAAARREARRRKTRVTTVLTVTPVKIALEAEVEARTKPDKCKGKIKKI
jgi:hypothetical protein